MYDTEQCPSCTSILDVLGGQLPHVTDRVNFTVVAKAAINDIRAWARKRGWRHLRLLSSRNNSYNRDYLGETEDWGQVPSLNVFRKTDDGIYHSYNTEMLFARTEEDQEPRHVDLIWPLWNLFDLTPEGRGTDWHPRFDYD